MSLNTPSFPPSLAEALNETTRAQVSSYGLNWKAFEDCRDRICSGASLDDINRISSKIEPLPSNIPINLSDIQQVDSSGQLAMNKGEVGSIILAGGMATRFGNVVKAAVEVFDGLSFLDLKLRNIIQAQKRFNTRIPVFIMASFATEFKLTQLIAPYLDRLNIRIFSQNLAPRLQLNGDILRTEHGKIALYATGHGDLPEAMQRSGLLDEFIAMGGRYLSVSNVDNLASTLSSRVLSAHIDSYQKMGHQITVEIAEKKRGDQGGAPCLVDGTPQIVEAFRFPHNFPHDTLAWFNTNTFFMNAAVLRKSLPLTWVAVRKSVAGHEAVQLERLIGELTRFLPTTFLNVPRSGKMNRFWPIKTPESLAREKQALRDLLIQRGALE